MRKSKTSVNAPPSMYSIEIHACSRKQTSANVHQRAQDKTRREPHSSMEVSAGKKKKKKRSTVDRSGLSGHCSHLRVSTTPEPDLRFHCASHALGIDSYRVVPEVCFPAFDKVGVSRTRHHLDLCLQGFKFLLVLWIYLLQCDPLVGLICRSIDQTGRSMSDLLRLLQGTRERTIRISEKKTA